MKNLPYTAAQAVAFGLPADEGLKAITFTRRNSRARPTGWDH
ncbi:MAG: hypothetical protein U1F83_05230 [Verrucomicrobiota bacterium]